MTRLTWQNREGLILVALLVLLSFSPPSRGESKEVVPPLEIVRNKNHLELRTTLPPGRHPLRNVLQTSDANTEGFIYATSTENDGSQVRIFQVSASDQSGLMRQISVRMRSSTQVGYYTLFFELAEAGKPLRSAVLRRNCCGYLLELSGEAFAGETYQGINLSTLERDSSDAFSEFLSIATACNCQGLRVDLTLTG
jgi:hypothetical protein